MWKSEQYHCDNQLTATIMLKTAIHTRGAGILWEREWLLATWLITRLGIKQQNGNSKLHVRKKRANGRAKTPNAVYEDSMGGARGGGAGKRQLPPVPFHLPCPPGKFFCPLGTLLSQGMTY